MTLDTAYTNAGAVVQAAEAEVEKASAPLIVDASDEPEIKEVTVELSDDQIVYSDDTIFVEGGIKPPMADEDNEDEQDGEEDEEFEEWEGKPYHHSHYSSSYPY